MKHFSEYLNESINHIYTLEFGKNEDASAGVTGVWETLNDLTR